MQVVFVQNMARIGAVSGWTAVAASFPVLNFYAVFPILSNLFRALKQDQRIDTSQHSLHFFQGLSLVAILILGLLSAFWSTRRDAIRQNSIS